MNWKFLNSPEYNFYKKFTNINNDSCIIKIRNDKKNSEHIDLLLFEDNLNLKNINALIADVCLWATNMNYAYVRMHTSNIKQKNLIKRKIFNIVRENRFLYYCKDDELNNIFKNNLYDWVLSDSDYDVIS